MWELKLSEWASNSLILISSLLLINILYEVVKSLFKSKYMGSMNRKPLRQRIKEYNKRWRERYE
nr:hypothetical protein [uncultured Mediterranean phage uvMED]